MYRVLKRFRELLGDIHNWTRTTLGPGPELIACAVTGLIILILWCCGYVPLKDVP